MWETPEQNSVAKRRNQTMVEIARSMLHEKRLSNEFCVEVVATSVHLLNISPTKAMRNMTPFEAWWKLKPNVSCLKIFGCVAYVLIAYGNCAKLDKKSENASLLDTVMKQ